MLEHEVRLGDGRSMAVAELGDPSSTHVVVSSHGTGSSRLEAVMYDETLGELGIRALALERPGYGESTADPVGRTLDEWGDDAAVALDQLGVGSFAISGYSGGGPHTLAIAAAPALADRVERVFLVAAVAPEQTDRSPAIADLYRRAREQEWSEFSSTYESEIMDELTNVTDADEAAFADPSYMENAMATVTEGLKQGGVGEASDHWAIGRPWGFELASVRQPVDVWHGEADTVVPVAHAHIYVAELVGASLHLLPNEGHFSIGRYLPEIMKVVSTT